MVRRNSPAPIISSTDRAAWIATSTLSGGRRDGRRRPALACLIEEISSTRVDRNAGRPPNTIAVTIVTAAEKIKTRASGETITPSGRLAPYTVGMNRLMSTADVRPKP